VARIKRGLVVGRLGPARHRAFRFCAANGRGTILLVAAMLLIRDGSRSIVAEMRPEDVVVRAGSTAFTRGKTVFSISDGPDSGELIFNSKTSDLEFLMRRGAGDLSTAGAVPAARKMELLRPLVARLLKDTGKADKYTFVVAHYTEIPVRLWNGIARSKDWDRRIGRPIQGDTRSFIKDVLERSGAYSELAETMARLGYKTQVGHVEKVIILPVARFPRGERLKINVPLKASDRLPYAWSEYFVLTRKE
jgi:hypothetical protein